MKDRNELLDTKGMLIYTNENCTGCNKCVRVCPTLVSNIAQEGKIYVNHESCVACGACLEACGHDARAYYDDTEQFFSDLDKISIPRLADGAVIRGGNPFMAVLGDQPHGQTNIEAPLDTIVQGVKQAMRESGRQQGGTYNLILELDGDIVFEKMIDLNQQYKSAYGRSAFN